MKELPPAVTRSKPCFGLPFGSALSIFAFLLSLLSPVYGKEFKHPGVLHTQEDFERMARKVDAEEKPWIDGWNVLQASPFAKSGAAPAAMPTVVRGGKGDNVARLYRDIARAYQCALVWKISGSKAHGDAARDILNAWSGTLELVTGNADRFLAGGIFGYQLANASEMMRDYPGFKLEQMQNMLLTVFYHPLNERFLYGNDSGVDHNDAHIQNYWANWDLCNLASSIAIGVFCDDREIYDRAVVYFKTGPGNGSIKNAIPILHGDGLGQWQEAGRDQGHTILGVGLMAAICEIAWNQGDDLYGWDDNRFLKGAEYVARYNLGHEVPFTLYEWKSGQGGAPKRHTAISSIGRGEVRPIWTLVAKHYVGRCGLKAPNVTAMVAKITPEGGPGGHATTFDQPGFGTLTQTLSTDAR